MESISSLETTFLPLPFAIKNINIQRYVECHKYGESQINFKQNDEDKRPYI